MYECVCVYILCMYVCMYARMYVVCMYSHANDFDKLITYQGAKALGSIQRTQYGYVYVWIWTFS